MYWHCVTLILIRINSDTNVVIILTLQYHLSDFPDLFEDMFFLQSKLKLLGMFLTIFLFSVFHVRVFLEDEDLVRIHTTQKLTLKCFGELMCDGAFPCCFFSFTANLLESSIC